MGLGNEGMDFIFDLTEISSNAEEMQPYIDYIYAVLNLYGHMCLSRNHEAIKMVKSVGLSHEHILCCLNTKHLNDKLKAAYLFLARVIFIDNDPYPSLTVY